MTKKLFTAALAVAATMFATEVIARLSGALDIPLYGAHAQLGYYIRPGQSGAFLHKHSWRFNELGMGSEPFRGGGTLLVGDSIVLGGNPVDEPDKLGPQLESRLGEQVWPISAGSWAMINELTWLRLHPEVVRRVDRIVFVTNSEDFTTPSVWRSPYTHPTRRPVCATCYLALRVIVPKIKKPEPPKPEGPWRQQLAAFLKTSDRPVTILLYPKRGEPMAVLHARAAQIKAIAPGVRVEELGTDPAWSQGIYRDEIHPTAAGYRVVAAAVARKLTSRQDVRPATASTPL